MKTSRHAIAFLITGALWRIYRSIGTSVHSNVLLFLLLVWICYWTNIRVCCDSERHDAHVTSQCTDDMYSLRVEGMDGYIALDNFPLQDDIMTLNRFLNYWLFLSLSNLTTKKTWKLCIAGPSRGKSTDHRWIFFTKGQRRGKWFHDMTFSRFLSCHLLNPLC